MNKIIPTIPGGMRGVVFDDVPPQPRISDGMAQLQRQLVQSGHACAAKRLDVFVMMVRRMELTLDEIAADAHEQDEIEREAAAKRKATQADIQAEAARPGTNLALFPDRITFRSK